MGREREGYWGLACWNALSAAQQTRLVEWGNLPFGYQPEGDGCDQPADLSVETRDDKSPGPRFYCYRCAIGYLQKIEETYDRRQSHRVVAGSAGPDA